MFSALLTHTYTQSTQESVCADAALATDGVARVRSRVVQSPERIRRTISSMGNTANEDKRTYMSRQATIDELQAKVSALLNIEKVLKF